MNKNQLAGKTVTLLVMGDGEGAVYVGRILFENDSPIFYYTDSEREACFPLPEDTLERIKVVGNEKEVTQKILRNSDYFLPLSIGPIPEGESPSTLLKTGLKWPDSDKENGGR